MEDRWPDEVHAAINVLLNHQLRFGGSTAYSVNGKGPDGSNLPGVVVVAVGETANQLEELVEECGVDTQATHYEKRKVN